MLKDSENETKGWLIINEIFMYVFVASVWVNKSPVDGCCCNVWIFVIGSLHFGTHPKIRSNIFFISSKKSIGLTYNIKIFYATNIFFFYYNKCSVSSALFIKCLKSFVTKLIWLKIYRQLNMRTLVKACIFNSLTHIHLVGNLWSLLHRRSNWIFLTSPLPRDMSKNK